METPRPLILAVLSTALLLASPLFLVAYDDNTTHPALTAEIIKVDDQLLTRPSGVVS